MLIYVNPGIENDIQRRDSLHAIINGLPDPNYATLRALVLVSWIEPSRYRLFLDTDDVITAS